uniref:Uncharacterized protein n=1 Tax=Oryza nivara TaxID=4536 RepID=A0A0E0IJC5_ORYNI
MTETTAGEEAKGAGRKGHASGGKPESNRRLWWRLSHACPIALARCTSSSRRCGTRQGQGDRRRASESVRSDSHGAIDPSFALLPLGDRDEEEGGRDEGVILRLLVSSPILSFYPICNGMNQLILGIKLDDGSVGSELLFADSEQWKSIKRKKGQQTCVQKDNKVLAQYGIACDVNIENLELA